MAGGSPAHFVIPGAIGILIGMTISGVLSSDADVPAPRRATYIPPSCGSAPAPFHETQAAGKTP